MRPPTTTMAPATELHATWLHPALGPEALEPNARDNARYSGGLSVTAPRVQEAQQAVGWLCGSGSEAVQAGPALRARRMSPLNRIYHVVP